MRQTGSGQGAEVEKPLEGFQSKIAPAAAKTYELHELAAEVAEELNIAQTDVALQLAL